MAKKSIEEEYKWLSQEEQILLRPDTQLGSVIEQEQEIWAASSLDLNDIKITKQRLKYKPAFIKLFDEIITNASDHYQRGGGVKNIRVTITPDFTITVWNDGKGIPVVQHAEHKIWLPEMLLGRLNSGSNYDDKEERVTGGRNGVGAGLVTLFSKKYIIDCADGKNSYYQEISDNLKNVSKPKIKPSTKSYTSVTYTPDFDRLDITGLEEDTLKVIIKRIVDIAVYSPKIKVWYNDKLIEINSVKDWCEMHLQPDVELFCEDINDRWSIGLAESTSDGFEHSSIVNGITTWIGGTHVDHIMNNIVRRLTEDLTKGKKGIKIRASDIKSKFHLFLVSKIVNPIFDTQTKENLKIKITDSIDLSDKTYKLLLKSKIIESILEWVTMKEQMELNKLNKKSAGKTVRLNKLKDAHKAGTNDGYKCKLAICEGDSAVGSVITGLSEVGRDYWGAFPIKGRPLNVRGASVTKITENDEITNIIKIIGLVPGKKYTSLRELRYGGIVFFTDADHFGLSIKGLLINFIHKMWPELLELGFCYEFITPIVIARKGKDKKEYYSIDKYDQDKNGGKLEGWTTKYYKGLGTVQASEMKEMFRNITKHLLMFKYVKERDSDIIDMVFNDKRVPDRKNWMITNTDIKSPEKFGKDNQVDVFFNNEFIQFSNYDNLISIPQVMDGFKPSHRKIMYAAFKKNITSEIKVAQFGSYVAEQTHYNHGEENLAGTIVGLAQDFIGTNNINLLMPKGNFASRENPKAAASSRYIFTELNPITRLIYKKEDEPILVHHYEDDDKIEPQFYLPIIPMLLVNGTEGIGTGWSTNIPNYDPLTLIKVIKKKLEKPDIKYKIHPWYRHFQGEIEIDEQTGKYVTVGVWTNTKKGIKITELPIEVWTDSYISHLNKLCDEKIIKDYVDNSTDTKIDIEVMFDKDLNAGKVLSKLKLTSNVGLTNMHTFVDKKITKWASVEELINFWFDERKMWYTKRKESWVKHLEADFDKLYNTCMFLKEVIKGDLSINNMNKADIVKQLEDRDYMKIEDSYDYLLGMPVYNLTKEKYAECKDKFKAKTEELEAFKLKSVENIWLDDLEELEKALNKTYK